MPSARVQSAAVSLIMHAGLLCLAASRSSAPVTRLAFISDASSETSISVEADAAGHTAVPFSGARHEEAEPAAAPAVETPIAMRPRERRLRPPPAAARAPRRDDAAVPGAGAMAAPAAAAPPPLDSATAGASAHRALAGADGASASPAARALPALSATPAAGTAGGTGIRSPKAASAGSGSTGDDARAQLLTRYLERVRTRVAQHREYPYLARRANLEGTICLRISIAASGSVLRVTATCGASHAPLLQAALQSVSRAAPFPPLPGGLGGRLTLDVPVVFELDAL